MATTHEGCLAMQKASKRAGRVILYGLQLRYAARYGDLVRAVRSGRIGAPRYISLLEYRGDWNNLDVWLYREPKSGRELNWRYSQAASGGTLNEKCCHYFDILNWIAGGVPERISCGGGLNVYSGRETWDHASVHLEYPGGVKAVHSLCMCSAHRLDLQVIGTEGSLQLMADHMLLAKRGARDGEKLPLTPEVGHGERGPARGTETAVLRMYADFLQCVRDGKQPAVSAESAVAASKMAFLSERSAAQRREVAWDALG